jgi:hypothetical protein
MDKMHILITYCLMTGGASILALGSIAPGAPSGGCTAAGNNLTELMV